MLRLRHVVAGGIGRKRCGAFVRAILCVKLSVAHHLEVAALVSGILHVNPSLTPALMLPILLLPKPLTSRLPAPLPRICAPMRSALLTIE